MCGVCTAVRPSPQVNVTSGWTWKAAYCPMTPSIIIQRNWIDCLLPIKEPTYHMSFVAIGIKSCLLQTICSEGFGESQDCPPQDWPHGGQSWGGQSWALSVIRIAHLNYNTIFSLPAWFRVVTIDSGCFDMISTYLIQSASMFNWFIIRFIMDTQIHKKVQLNIFTHWVICLSSIQLWKGKWAGRGLLYKYIFSSVHPA